MATDIPALRLRQKEIDKRIDILEHQLKAERDAVLAENSRRLRELSADTERRIRSHDRSTDERYRQILESYTSQTGQQLRQEIGSLRTEYEELGSRVTEELARQQQEREQLFLLHNQFEQAYTSHQEFAKEQALIAQERFNKRFYEVLENIPMEWFLPGHIDIYRRRAEDNDRWIKNGLYESAVGIGGNMLMQLEFDILETEERFDRWMAYYDTLRAVAAEEEQIFIAAHRLPPDMPLFGAYLRIKDMRLTDEILDRYSSDGYSELHREYESAAVMYTLGIPDSPEQIRRFMIDNPGLSQKVSDISMYERISSSIARQNKIKDTFFTMFSRMEAWEERLGIYKEIRAVLTAKGCACRLSDLGETHIVSFTDDMEIHHFELILTPVLRRRDGKWIDLASCYIPDGIDKSRFDDIRTALAQVIVTKGIDIDYRKAEPGQTTADRVKAVSADKTMLVNGRLN